VALMEAIRRRTAALRLIMVLFAAAIAVRLAYLVSVPNYQATAKEQGTYTIQTAVTNGNIYDANFELLVNDTVQHIAVMYPTAEAVSAVLPHVLDKTAFYEKLQYGTPFSCEIDTNQLDCDAVTVFDVPYRSTETQLAQHLIGYTRDGVGVTGLEADYDTLLRSVSSQSSVTFTVNGRSSVLAGEQTLVHTGQNITTGVVTTLRKEVQEICETVGTELQLEKGCIIVMDAQNGDILALCSFPTYTVSTLADALESSDSPLINRALYAYPVGSIFKLIPATCALEQNYSQFQYDCTGSISISDQIFHCHDLTGHGVQSLQTAMIHSCNPYFIALSQKLSAAKLYQTASKFGFGTSISLTESIVADGGVLPDLQALQIPAEKANFCFGQGMLTASPLQIARMTCAIANGGTLPETRLIRGTTEDGVSVSLETTTEGTSILTEETATTLQNLMIAAAYGSDTFQGVPEHISVGAKTSTAQTGRYDEDGVEYCHGWITGFFPASAPRYVVTVLAEDGGYGNDASAPVFRAVIDAIVTQNALPLPQNAIS
jgi:penicillin-binding protein 2